MTPRYDLLPRRQSDDEAVAQLRQLLPGELRPPLPHVAEWLEEHKLAGKPDCRLAAFPDEYCSPTSRLVATAPA